MGAASGGAATGGVLGALAGAALTIGSAGSLSAVGVPMMLGGVAAGGGIGATMGHGMQSSAQAATNSRNAADDASRNQRINAADASRKLLERPKNINSDSFLAMKAKQLAQLRMGMGNAASSQSAPEASLSAPTLTGQYPGKKKLGQ